jgi:hypothetical protein
MVQQKSSTKYEDTDFDTKVLDAYTARTTGANSNKAEREENA